MQVAAVMVRERVTLGEYGTCRGTVDALPVRRGRHAAREGLVGCSREKKEKEGDRRERRVKWKGNDSGAEGKE